jgi:hypothetical protein
MTPPGTARNSPLNVSHPNALEENARRDREGARGWEKEPPQRRTRTAPGGHLNFKVDDVDWYAPDVEILLAQGVLPKRGMSGASTSPPKKAASKTSRSWRNARNVR